MNRTKPSVPGLSARFRFGAGVGIVVLAGLAGYQGLRSPLGAPVPVQPKAVPSLPEQPESKASPIVSAFLAAQKLPQDVVEVFEMASEGLEPLPKPRSKQESQKPKKESVAVAKAAAAPPAAERKSPAVEIRAAVSPIESDLFPTPVFLGHAVRFWERVYSEFSKDHYVVHDRDSLVILAVLDLSSVPDSPKDRQKLLDVELKQYSKRLRRVGEKLADGADLEKLPPDEQRWVAAFMQSEERDIFSAASDRLRIQRGQKNQFGAGLQRAGRYMDTMQAIFRQYGLPTDLCFLPHVESSFNHRAISKVGASGIWQFMPATGKMYMEVGKDVDERNDPILATEAAARLLSKNFRHLKTWPLALTAYNHGLSGMMRAVEQTGQTDLGVIVRKYQSPTFGFASKNFYTEFLAARHVALRQSELFPDLRPDPLMRYDELTLPHAVGIGALAQNLAVDPDELHSLNPALHSAVLTGARYVPRGYRLRLPVREGADWAASLPQPEPPKKAAKKADKKAEAKAKKGKPIAKSAVAKSRLHTVRAGETLEAIAKRYGTSVKRLMADNGIRSAKKLKAGQKLKVPRSA